MKKILSILSSIILTVTTISNVLSCKIKEKNIKYNDENGDSIWAWIPGIFDGKKVTSPNIWNILKNPFIDIKNEKWSNNPIEWDSSTKIKMAVQLINILSVSILANSNKFFENEYIDNHKINNKYNIADYQDLKNILKKQWELLIINTNNIVEKKKQNFKDSDKKNWEKKYYDFLDSTYKDISGAVGNKKHEIEEQNYKADIMTTGADNGISAIQMLTNILLNNNMRIYKQTTTSSTVQLLQNFVSFIKKNKNIKIWNNDNQNFRIQLALAFNWDEKTNSFIENLNQLTIEKINNYLNKIADDLKKYNYDYLSYIINNPPFKTPVFENSTKEKIGNPALSETYDIGQFSLFQKYIIEKWFQNEKPLAISTITYNFKSGILPTDTGFTEDVFNEETKNKINKDLIKLKLTKNWDEFIKNSEEKVFSSENLLTLSSDSDSVKSNILKSAVYNSIDNKGKTLPNNLNNLIKEINRNNINDEISANWIINNNNDNNDNNSNNDDIIIGFFDTNGLNLTHIDGREYLKSVDLTSYKEYDSNWQFKILNYSNNFYNNTIDKSNILTLDKTNQIMNNQFSNAQYLWYLVNRSLLNKNKNSVLKFKILDEVKKYTILNSNSDSPDNKTWWFWIYDFFNNFNNKILENNVTPEKWLKKFINFKYNQNKNNFDWFISIINAMSSNLSGGAIQRMYNNFEIENRTIQEYKIEGPAAEIKTKNIINKINTSKIWKIKN